LNVRSTGDSAHIKAITSFQTLEMFACQLIHKNYYANFEFMEMFRHWGVQILTLIYYLPPPKLNGVRSGDLGGYTVGPPLPIYVSGKRFFRNC